MNFLATTPRSASTIIAPKHHYKTGTHTTSEDIQRQAQSAPKFIAVSQLTAAAI